MWVDELQHWGIAVESESLFDVFYNLRYESSPALWQLCLYPITRLTHDPVWMQVFHVALATAAAAIFLIWSPFTKLQKTLFVFGYFPIFEYAVISRHYVMGELLLFAFLALYPWGGKRAIWAGVVLFLQSQTSFFGFVIAFACVAAMVTHYWVYREPGARPVTRVASVGLAIAFMGLVTSFLQLLQHPDSPIHLGWDFINPWRSLQAGTITWRSLVPIPTFGIEFWNTNFLDSFHMLHHARNLPSLLAQGFLSACIVLGSAFWFRSRPESLVLFLTVTLGCLAFFYLKKLGYLRHHGHLYLAWIGSVWLLWNPRLLAKKSNTTRQAVPAPRNWTSHVVTVILAMNVVSACLAVNMEVRYPFSAAKAAAGWIRDRGHADDVLIGPTSIAGHLDRDVYILPNARFGRFKYYRRPWKSYTDPELVELARTLETQSGKQCLLVLEGQSDFERADVGLTKVADFEAGILPKDKSMSVYMLTQNLPLQKEAIP